MCPSRLTPGGPRLVLAIYQFKIAQPFLLSISFDREDFVWKTETTILILRAILETHILSAGVIMRLDLYTKKLDVRSKSVLKIKSGAPGCGSSSVSGKRYLMITSKMSKKSFASGSSFMRVCTSFGRVHEELLNHEREKNQYATGRGFARSCVGTKCGNLCVEVHRALSP